MSSRFAILGAFVGGVFLASAGHANAELATNSPFLPPPGQAQAAAPTTVTPLELRGLNSVNGITMFSIFDPVKKSGSWVKLNESGHDFAVKKYDPDNDTVTIEYQGRSLAVAMKTPKIASSGSAIAPLPSPIPSPIATVRPGPGGAAVIANPTPATEAARLADWSAEIQRRRDMRAQATGQPAAAAQPASAPPVEVAPVRPQAQPNQMQNGGGNQRMRGPQRRNGQ